MLQLKNTLSKQKEPFPSLDEVMARPLERQFVSIYTCGPTVYDYASVGNFSAYLMADLVKKYLQFLGYPVKHVINITDVGHLTADADVAGEDKLEISAKKEGVDPYRIAEKYTNQFLSDAAALSISADVWPRASEHIPQMIALIEDLIKNECAYVTLSGVYFDVAKDPDYGKLSGNNLDQLKTGVRVEAHPDKKHPADFALWKLNQPHHLMQWDSPWGRGYPGWHIECSAMSMHYLGQPIDIHSGGEDNIFPHHEAEIAQVECATGRKPFVRFWLHRQFLTVDGQKMSKNLGNTYRLQDVVEKGFSPEDFRMLILAAHYRSGVNFTWDALHAAKERRLSWRDAYQVGAKMGENPITELTSALNDDLNTPLAFAVVDAQVKSGRAGQPAAVEFWQTVDKLFGLGLSEVDTIPAEIEQQRQALDAARLAGDFGTADFIRAEIIAAGYEVSTEVSGTRLKKK